MKQKMKKMLAAMLSICMILGTVQISGIQAAAADDYFKGPNIGLFNAGYWGAAAYRIPAVATSKKTGTVISAIEMRRFSSADTGVNEVVARRSEDNGKTWEPLQFIVDLENYKGYTMDPELIVDNDPESEHYGRIYVLMDMFQDGCSLWTAEAGTGYTKIGDNYYRILKDASGNQYTVRENGVVYDSNGAVTNYQVETNAPAPYTQLGSLYKDGERIGNIYKGAELTMVKTCYLWLSYSDDDGLTWSLPKDITPQVKADWMTFFGTGPGAGVQLQNGRLMFTTYCMDTKNQNNRFSSFNIYSDDDGETWHRGASPNPNPETSTRELNESCITELNNGHLIQFMKNATAEVAMAVSTDQGASWSEVTYARGIPEIYCEMAVVHYPELITDPRDGVAKEAIIFANPSKSGRYNGTVRIAFVNEDDTLDWAYSKVIDDGKFLYNSLTVMNDGNIGMVYENEGPGRAYTGAAFTSFSPSYIMEEGAFERTSFPTDVTAKLLDASGNETTECGPGTTVSVEMTFNEAVRASGNVGAVLTIGGEERLAALKETVNETTLRFAYVITEQDKGDIVVTAGVRAGENGVAENTAGISMTDNPIATKDMVIGTVGSSLYPELPLEGMSATAGSAQSGAGPEKVLGEDDIWHSLWAGDDWSNLWIDIDLGGSRLVNGLSYTPRADGGNGTITEYQIQVSTDGVNYTPVSRGTWASGNSTKTAAFGGAVLASHVRLYALQSVSDSGKNFASADEIRIFGTTDTAGAADATELLVSANAVASLGEDASLSILAPGLQTALADAQSILTDGKATASEIKAAASALQKAVAEEAAAANKKLPAEIAKESGKVKDDYSISSWNVYSQALSTAKALTAAATDMEVLEAYLNLVNAEQALHSQASVNDKQEFYNSVLAGHRETVKAGQGEYTDESWKAYVSAVTALETAYRAGKDMSLLTALAGQAEQAKGQLVTPAQKAVNDARAKAKPELDKALGICAAGQKNYTDESWKAYDSAAKALKQAYDEGKSAEDILSKLAALQKCALTEKASDVPGPGPAPKPALVKGKSYTTSDGLTYKVTNVDKKTVTLTGATAAKKKKLTSLTVKPTVKIEGVTCKVTEIGSKAFAKCKKLKKVTVGANVTKIGKQAFSGCSALKSITLKTKALKSVGSGAFKGIHKKAVIKLPKLTKAQKNKYKKILSKKGQAKTVKVK